MGRPFPQHFRRDGRAKRAYDSKDAARAEAVKQRMAFYRCGFCGRWHLARTK